MHRVTAPNSPNAGTNHTDRGEPVRPNDAAPVVTVENLIWAASIACLVLIWAISAVHLEARTMSTCGPAAGSTATAHPGDPADGRPAPTDCPR
ncbi:hypothetical protein AB0442_22980 [Kitasatospora sp. NPDC085895]|uniref:hypothetical protein n=1 Tax=Kitasatospora sp. NPDC085895 TaxID=3155057 RepID=UPI00344BE762